MKISKHWAMPNKETFTIKPIKDFIISKLEEELKKKFLCIVDPFSNKGSIEHEFLKITRTFLYYNNDIDTDMPSKYHMDALEFLKKMENGVADIILFDPPFSPRQLSECYKKIGESVTFKMTSSKYWSDLKKEISRVIVPGGLVITCAWNSNGIGKNNGFRQEEILIVSHGGNHNDTICVAERKV